MERSFYWIKKFEEIFICANSYIFNFQEKKMSFKKIVVFLSLFALLGVLVGACGSAPADEETVVEVSTEERAYYD